MSEPAETSIFSAQGGLRDLNSYSPEQIAAMPADKRALFDALKVAQAKCQQIASERAKVGRQIDEASRLIDDLTAARDKEHPRPTFQDCHRAMMRAHRGLPPEE